jgi:hypothetical protein
VSAFATPTRRPYHARVRELPASQLLFGSDFPTPVLELSAGPEEWWDDFKAIVETGRLDRLVIPEDNLLDVNYRELKRAFGPHPMFTNFAQLLASCHPGFHME